MDFIQSYNTFFSMCTTCFTYIYIYIYANDLLLSILEIHVATKVNVFVYKCSIYLYIICANIYKVKEYIQSFWEITLHLFSSLFIHNHLSKVIKLQSIKKRVFQLKCSQYISPVFCWSWRFGKKNDEMQWLYFNWKTLF